MVNFSAKQNDRISSRQKQRPTKHRLGDVPKFDSMHRCSDCNCCMQQPASPSGTRWFPFYTHGADITPPINPVMLAQPELVTQRTAVIDCDIELANTYPHFMALLGNRNPAVTMI